MRLVAGALPFIVSALLGIDSAHAAELRSTRRISHAERTQHPEDRFRVDRVYVSWLDDETIVYRTTGGTLRCRNLRTDAELWSTGEVFEVDGFSVCRKQRKLAVSYRASADILCGRLIRIIDCATGATIDSLDAKRLDELLGSDFVLPTNIALTPDDARLVVCDFASSHGSNAYVLDPTFSKLETHFSVDARPSELTLSPDGRRATVLAAYDTLCVQEIATNQEIFFSGQRVAEKKLPAAIPNAAGVVMVESLSTVIGPPFKSHARHDGKDWLICSIDGGCWQMGRVAVIDLKTKQESLYEAGNQHIEMDVDFAKQRIALTGTSDGLTLMAFDGTVLANLPKAVMYRPHWIEFSPSGTQLAIGSGDGEVSLFTIDE